MNGNLIHDRMMSETLGRASSTAVTPYERVSGFLVSAVCLAGITTGLLGLLFFLNMQWDQSPKTPMFVFNEFPGFEKPEGIAEDFKEPGVEELAEVDQPQLADALEMVTSAVSTVRAAIEKVDGPAEKSGLGDGEGDRRTKGLTIGDNGEEIPAQHWLVKYSSTSKKDYAAQLDFFKIEIGSLSRKTSLIEYVSNLTADKPKYRKATRKDEKRVYFKKPNNHPVMRWDKEMLKAGGAETDDRYIFTFYPPEAIKKLELLEKKKLERDGKKMSDVKRTVFTVEATKNGFVYNLSSIKYH